MEKDTWNKHKKCFTAHKSGLSSSINLFWQFIDLRVTFDINKDNVKIQKGFGVELDLPNLTNLLYMLT